MDAQDTQEVKYRYSITACGTYPGAVPWHWGWLEAASAHEAAAVVWRKLDAEYPQFAPHSVWAELDPETLQ